MPYCHVVFTLPHELSPIARQNPKLIYDLLFRTVREALLTIAADPKRLGAHLGFLSVLHTWDQKMLHHPHLHCLVPAGGLSLDRSQWIPCRKRFFLPGRVLAARFRKQFLESLAAYFGQKKLRLCGALSALRRPAAFDRLYRTLKRKNWVVYPKLLTLDAVEFVRRFLIHVLPQGFVKIRHFGFLANSKRRASLTLCRSLIGDVAPNVAAQIQRCTDPSGSPKVPFL